MRNSLINRALVAKTKLFNYALLAAALLIGVNVNAETVIEVSDPANLQAAFNDAADDITVKITSMGVQFNQIATIELNAAKKWTLDLNGHDLVFNQPNADNGSMFVLRKGILRVKNGNVINATPVKAGTYKNDKGSELRCFYVYGESKKSTKTEGQNIMDLYSSQLYINEGVFVDCTYGKDGIEIYFVDGTEEYAKKKTAFGVYVNIAGKVHGEKYGVQMTGNVNATPTSKEEVVKDSNYPWYVIEKTAEIYANPTLTNNGGAGLYLGGYCIADIYGYIHGASGVYVKNGLVNIKDAVIASDYTGDYATTGHDGSSTQGAGSAIVIESSKVSYGETNVTISGDTKVTSQVGYAIEQDVTDGNEDKINAVHINGGTFEGGTEGGVIFDASSVSGGKVNIEDGNFTDDDVTKYIPQGNATIVDDGQGNQTVVVSQKPAGEPAKEENINGQANLEWNTGKDQTISSGTVKVGFFNMQKGSVTVKAGATFEITDKLIMGGEARIVVEPGATLISSGDKGIVAPSVENITVQTNELADNPAQFLFNPAVNSNKNTNATLQIIANSFTKPTGEYLNQRFGIPTHNAIKKITAVKSAADPTPVQVGISKWDPAKNAWIAVGYLNVPGASLHLDWMTEPFQYFQLQCNNENKSSVISMSGEMVSNSNNTLKVIKGWNTFANSYSGKMDIKPMLDALMAVDGMATAVYKAQQQTEEWVGFDAVDFTTLVFNNQNILNPMEAFLFKNDNDVVAQFVLNYKNMVWDPIVNPAPKAPRHNSYETMAKIGVMQNDQNIDAVYMIQDANFTADIDRGYESEKYMNEKVNFYVNGADMKQQTLATNVLDGTYLGFAAKEAGVYTLNFDKMSGNNLVLVDLVNGQEIDMVEGAQYSFKVDANYSNDNRFMVKNAAKAPTATDKVDAKANAVKVISDGQFRIVKDGRAYNAIGAEL